ncbi:hypothetical protein KM043_006236 [Ampulex compressa]|nr:hypothetical protein KM043_006236 [Ampulex compressa]
MFQTRDEDDEDDDDDDDDDDDEEHEGHEGHEGREDGRIETNSREAAPFPKKCPDEKNGLRRLSHLDYTGYGKSSFAAKVDTQGATRNFLEAPDSDGHFGSYEADLILRSL